jgi:serine/threonine protein kinase
VRAYELRRDPRPTLVLEALPGMTLEYWLSDANRLEGGDLVHLAEHVTSAVTYLHTKGVLHLDLKPGNLLCSYGVVRLIDLSLARPPGRGHRGAGTHVYLAPEQALGEEVGPWSDVWGIGVVLWEAAAGRRPFERPADREAYEQLQRRAEPIGTLVDELPAGFAELIDHCLDPLPANRPSVAEVWQVIEPHLE